MQRIGSKGAMGDFAKALCAHLTPQLLTAQHLEQLLRIVQLEDAVPEEECLKAALRLLADSAQAAPRMFAGLEPQARSPSHPISLHLNSTAFTQSIPAGSFSAVMPCGCLLANPVKSRHSVTVDFSRTCDI